MIDILRTRRSIRKYENNPVDQGSVDVLKEALLRCPSSRGINPWTFIFVDDADVIDKLARSKAQGSASQRCAPCHRRVRGRGKVGRVGGRLLHCIHSGAPHGPFPKAMKLLDPNQEQGPLPPEERGRLHTGTARTPEKPEGGGDRRSRFPGREQEPGTGGATELRADKA